MRFLAHAATLLIMGGAFAGAIVIAGTTLQAIWVKQVRDDAERTGTRPVYGKCLHCPRPGHHLHRPSILLDPEPYCDGCYAAEVTA